MENTNEDTPLMPESAIEFYYDALSQKKYYLKAVSIRLCLETIVDTVFVHFVNSQEAKKNG